MILTFRSSGAFAFSSFIAMSVSLLTPFTLCFLSLFTILSLYLIFTFSVCCPRNLVSRITFLVGEVEDVVCKVRTAFFFLTKVTCGRFYPLQMPPNHNFRDFMSQWILPSCSRDGLITSSFISTSPASLMTWPFPLLTPADFCLHFYFRALFRSLFSPLLCLSRRMLCLASCCKYCTVILCK